MLDLQFPRDTKLYDILYYFYSSTNQIDATFDTLLKRTRSTMTGNYLASEESVKKVLKNSIDLLSFVKEKGMEKKVFEVKMLCRSIVSRCQRSFSQLEEFKQLKELMEYHVSYNKQITKPIIPSSQHSHSCSLQQQSLSQCHQP